jgi:hypothetical protein
MVDDRHRDLDQRDPDLLLDLGGRGFGSRGGTGGDRGKEKGGRDADR